MLNLLGELFNMKKSLFVLATAMFALASCGQKANTPKNVNIVVWGPAEEEPVVKAIVDKYNAANPDDKIEYSFNVCSEADGGTTLAADPTVTNYASLFAFADDHLGNLVNKNVVRKLGGTNLSHVKDADTENSIESASYTVNGTKDIFAYPISTDNGYFLYYDGAVFGDEDVKTFEGLLAKAAEKNKEVVMDVPNGWYSAAFFLAQGVCGTDSLKYETVKKEDGTNGTRYNITWDNDNGVKMAKATSELFVQYNNESTIDGKKNTFLTGDDKVVSTEAASGKLAAVVTGTWNENMLEEKFGELKACKLPTLADHQLGSFSGTKLYGVNAYATTDEQRTAHKLANLLTNKESQILRYQQRKSFPCNKEALADPAYTQNMTIGAPAFIEQGKYSAIQSRAAEGRYWDIGKAIGDVMVKGYMTSDKQKIELKTEAEWKDFLTDQITPLRSVA